MSYLFNRDLEISIGAVKVSLTLADPIRNTAQPVLRCSFNVEKNVNRDPNRATLQVFNLNQTNRSALQEGAALAAKSPAYSWPLIIKAGYVGSIAQIFSGDIRTVESHKEGVNWITTLEASDGGFNFASARMAQTFGPGTPVSTLLVAAAAKLGVGLGNSAIAFGQGVWRKGYGIFKKGVTVSGRVSDILDKYISSTGYQWSIQDGELQVLAPDAALLDVAVILNEKTGLIGSPEKTEDGGIKAKTLLQGTIKPGRRIVLTSISTNGSFKAEKVAHIGDTWGNDWYTEFEAKAAMAA